MRRVLCIGAMLVSLIILGVTLSRARDLREKARVWVEVKEMPIGPARR